MNQRQRSNNSRSCSSPISHWIDQVAIKTIQRTALFQHLIEAVDQAPPYPRRFKRVMKRVDALVIEERHWRWVFTVTARRAKHDVRMDNTRTCCIFSLVSITDGEYSTHESTTSSRSKSSFTVVGVSAVSCVSERDPWDKPKTRTRLTTVTCAVWGREWRGGNRCVLSGRRTLDMAIAQSNK